MNLPLQKLIDFRKELHQYPELSNDEIGEIIYDHSGKNEIKNKLFKQAEKKLGTPPQRPNFNCDDWTKSTLEIVAVNKCIAQTLIELKRPVRIRDCYFNIQGRTDDYECDETPYSDKC